MREKIKKIAQFLFNPKFLLCFGIGWMITNGWSYILFGLGTWLKSPWMLAISGAYLTFLWLPISPEKIVTLAIAIALLRWLFPHDKKTLGVLYHLSEKTKEAYQTFRSKRKERRIQRRQLRRNRCAQ